VVRLAKTMEIVLAEFGLTMNQYRMLTFIDAGAPSLREVGKRLVMKRPNVSVLIDGLVERGWVRRSRSEADGRRIELELTGKGQQLLRRAEDACDEALAWLARDAGAEERLLNAIDSWEPVLDGSALAKLREEQAEGARRSRRSRPAST
jgi:DNA-binding MarR family transcriptional regulator